MPVKLVGVIGGHSHNTTPEALELAELFGAEIGRRGFGVICGGEGGVMDAACRGCQSVGGHTVGILKGNVIPSDACPLDFAIVTSMDVASNNIIVWSASGIIALDGRFGTLNEIALALDFGKPLIAVGAPRFFSPGAVHSRHFAHYEGYEPGRVSHIMDHLEQMMGAAAHGTDENV